jgi:hypothetical protein
MAKTSRYGMSRAMPNVTVIVKIIKRTEVAVSQPPSLTRKKMIMDILMDMYGS